MDDKVAGIIPHGNASASTINPWSTLTRRPINVEVNSIHSDVVDINECLGLISLGSSACALSCPSPREIEVVICIYCSCQCRFCGKHDEHRQKNTQHNSDSPSSRCRHVFLLPCTLLLPSVFLLGILINILKIGLPPWGPIVRSLFLGERSERPPKRKTSKSYLGFSPGGPRGNRRTGHEERDVPPRHGPGGGAQPADGHAKDERAVPHLPSSRAPRSTRESEGLIVLTPRFQGHGKRKSGQPQARTKPTAPRRGPDPAERRRASLHPPRVETSATP